MKITKVKFGQLRSYGEFQNMTVEAEALIEGQETPESALEQVRSWVANQLAEAIERPKMGEAQVEFKELWEEYAVLKSEKWKMESVVADLQRKARKLQTLEGIADAQGGAGAKEGA